MAAPAISKYVVCVLEGNTGRQRDLPSPYSNAITRYFSGFSGSSVYTKQIASLVVTDGRAQHDFANFFTAPLAQHTIFGSYTFNLTPVPTDCLRLSISFLTFSYLSLDTAAHSGLYDNTSNQKSGTSRTAPRIQCRAWDLDAQADLATSQSAIIHLHRKAQVIPPAEHLPSHACGFNFRSRSGQPDGSP
jgi:hypothetical protein